MSKPIEEQYFDWLCAKVIPLHSDNYYGLLSVMFKMEFVWIEHGDHNRAAEGLELRADFLTETNVGPDRLWLELPASVLEVLIALAKRANFQTDLPVREWFWQFIVNLGLEDYRRITDSDIPAITQKLNVLIWRTYGSDGRGGLFPLHEPHRDQRRIEIWFQFCDYVEDQRIL